MENLNYSLIESEIGLVNENELLELAVSGTGDPRLWTPLASTMKCVTAVSAVGTFITNFFSCPIVCE